MRITERHLLDEIGNIVADGNANGPSHESRQGGKKFYNFLDLPPKLKSYIEESREQSIPAAATQFGMSPGSLKRILNGEPLSENMLFRLRNYLEYALGHPGISVMHDEPDAYFGDWRRTSTSEVQFAITHVAHRLLYLKKVVEASNSLLSEPDGPIDPIQVAQLVALLEATLAALKAPLVEKEQTAGVFGFLKKLGKRVLAKKSEDALSAAIDGAVEAGSELLEKLGDAPSVSDLGNIVQ
jgi:hypothetical protein